MLWERKYAVSLEGDEIVRTTALWGHFWQAYLPLLKGTLNTSAPGIQIIATELELGCAFI